MKEVWFIGHGECMTNETLPITPTYNIPLTSKGQEQARALANDIDNKPELIIMTSYLRTQQTAKPVLEKFPDLPTTICPFHEFNYRCTGATPDEYKPWAEDYWNRCDADYIHGDDAESFIGFKTRVIYGIKQLQQREEDFILVFAHSHAIRAVWQYLLNKKEVIDNRTMQYFRDKMGTLQIKNTEIFKCIYLREIWTSIDPIFEPESNQTITIQAE